MENCGSGENVNYMNAFMYNSLYDYGGGGPVNFIVPLEVNLELVSDM